MRAGTHVGSTVIVDGIGYQVQSAAPHGWWAVPVAGGPPVRLHKKQGNWHVETAHYPNPTPSRSTP